MSFFLLEVYSVEKCIRNIENQYERNRNMHVPYSGRKLVMCQETFNSKKTSNKTRMKKIAHRNHYLNNKIAPA